MEQGFEAPMQPSRMKRYMPGKKVFAFGITLLIIAVFAGTAFYYYRAYQALRANPQIAVQDEVAKTVGRVGALMLLPQETPNVATIADIKALKEQPFFTSAKQGDNVLIYPNARKIIIYRPSENKIVDVGALNIGGK